MATRKLVAELVGTAALVFFAVGAATLSFGFRLYGTSPSAGIVMTALSFGLVLIALVYTLSPISGAHVNPAVTLGFVVARRMHWREAVGYWIAQVAGGIIGALLLWAVFSGSSFYHRAVMGLGADGWGAASMIGLSLGGAFLAELILTFLFVLVVLAVTGQVSSKAFAGLAIGTALAVVHLVGIPLTGTSVNPARSIGPALVAGGTALQQLWLFIVAPLIGGAVAAVVWREVLASRPLGAAAGRAAEQRDEREAREALYGREGEVRDVREVREGEARDVREAREGEAREVPISGDREREREVPVTRVTRPEDRFDHR